MKTTLKTILLGCVALGLAGCQVYTHEEAQTARDFVQWKSHCDNLTQDWETTLKVARGLEKDKASRQQVVDVLGEPVGLNDGYSDPAEFQDNGETVLRYDRFEGTVYKLYRLDFRFGADNTLRRVESGTKDAMPPP